MKTTKTVRIVAIALLPLMFAACSVRQLADGSWTSCKVGESCQVGPKGAAAMAPVKPMHNNKHHHHMMKKKVAPVAKKASDAAAPKADDKK